MNRIHSILATIAINAAFSSVSAKDAIYRLKDEHPTGMTVDNTDLVIRMPLEPVAPPKAKRMTLMEAQGSLEGGYLIQIDLAAAPPKNLRPVVVLGESTLVEGVSVGGSDEAGYTITLGSNDLTIAREWLNRLQTLFGLDNAHVDDQTLIKEKK